MEVTLSNICPSELCKMQEGLEISCEFRNRGGNDNNIYIINKCDIASYDFDYTTNIVNSFTLNTNTTWFLVQARLDSIAWEETVNQQTGFYTQNLTFILDLVAQANTVDDGAQALLNFLHSITNPYNDYVAVFTHNMGFRRVFGLLEIRGLKNGGGTVGTSGTNFEELGGYTITMTASAGEPAPVLAIGAALPTV